ncbi:MAG TPA: hypothetical protein VEZ15_12925, partial [Acidimicrobiia bacterium]|nr:hypothetical protein [Acidimicrobiia bacterium]
DRERRHGQHGRDETKACSSVSQSDFPLLSHDAGDTDAACLAGTYAPAVSPFPAGKLVNHPYTARDKFFLGVASASPR